MEKLRKLEGATYKAHTGCGGIFVTVNYKDGKPHEVFATLGKAGGCASAQTEAIGRLTSACLRQGVEVSKIVHQLQGIQCHTGASCADAIASVLENKE